MDDVGQYLQTGSRVGLGSGSHGFRRPDTTLQTAAATPHNCVTQPGSSLELPDVQLVKPDASCSHLAGPVQVLPVLGQLVQGQEGVAVAGGAVAKAVAFPEQAALPDDLGAVSGLLQVLLLLEDLPGDQETRRPGG